MGVLGELARREVRPHCLSKRRKGTKIIGSGMSGDILKHKKRYTIVLGEREGKKLKFKAWDLNGWSGLRQEWDILLH